MNWNPFKKLKNREVDAEFRVEKNSDSLPEFNHIQWTNEDALVYKSFLSGTTGKKILKIYDNKIVQTSMNACIEDLDDRAFHAGIAAGVMQCRAMRQVMCKTSDEVKKAKDGSNLEATPEEVQEALNELVRGGAKAINLGEE